MFSKVKISDIANSTLNLAEKSFMAEKKFKRSCLRAVMFAVKLQTLNFAPYPAIPRVTA